MSHKEEKVRQMAENAKRGARTKLRHLWWAFLLRGLLALALAASALFWPQSTIKILTKLLGAYFLIDGVASAVGALRAGTKTAYPQAIVGLVAGLALLFWPEISAKLFLMVVGAWALLQGGGMFMSSRELEPDHEARGVMAMVGAIMAIIGLVFIFWPETGVVAISWMIAVGALVVGSLLIFLATRLRRVKQRLDNFGP